MLPWVPRERGYPSKCSMVDSSQKDTTFLNHTSTYFHHLASYTKDYKMDQFSAARSSVISFVETSPKKSCDNGWTYDHSLVFNTITSENNWVCEEDYKPMLIQTIFWVGNIIGCFLWGFTNDHFGRKPTVVLTHA